MNFIEETNKHARALEAWKKGHGFSDREALQDLADIWDEFKESRKLEIYGSHNSIIPKTDLSCGSCVFDMLTFVYNWRKALEHEVTVDFKGVPQAKIEIPTPAESNLYADKKMHELRSLAKQRGIEYTNKTKASELIEKLNAAV